MSESVTTSIFPSAETAIAAARAVNELEGFPQAEPLDRDSGGMPLFVLEIKTSPAGEETREDSTHITHYWWPEEVWASVVQETKEGKREVWRGFTTRGDWEAGEDRTPLPYEEVLANMATISNGEITTAELAKEIAKSVGYGGGYMYPGTFWVMEDPKAVFLPEFVNPEAEPRDLYLRHIRHFANDYDRGEDMEERIAHNRRVLEALPEGAVLGVHRVMSKDEDHNGLARLYVKLPDGRWSVHW